MSDFRRFVHCSEPLQLMLQGNQAFALGVAHAGYHAADGYPGTPSTEVIDKSLAHVQDRMTVGWSVNEAVAWGVAVGHAMAGRDVVCTMKIPGVFQAGDVITTSAFSAADAGALVLYAATDYVPSSTQHVIDARYFFSSARMPVLEPRDHQDMYECAFVAQALSKRFKTPVVVLASGILAHSEGLVGTRGPHRAHAKENLEALKDWMLLPGLARRNYDEATTRRIPEVAAWLDKEKTGLVTFVEGERNASFGVIACGESGMIVQEALIAVKLSPPILKLGMTYPLPKRKLLDFANRVEGKIFVIEEGHRYLQERLILMGMDPQRLVGKDEESTITDWTPRQILDLLEHHLGRSVVRGAGFSGASNQSTAVLGPFKAVDRPPTICPGCPYKAFGLVVRKLKKKKKLVASFGDIGCSTLLYFLDAVDTVLCMGASDSVRQGFVSSRPEMAGKSISVLGDSCECHSGLDSTRNAVFRNTPGVKVILDNRITAMTGGQPAPSSPCNLAGVPNKFELEDALRAEQCRVEVVNAYNMREIEEKLTTALDLAESSPGPEGRAGVFTTLIIEGPCIQESERGKRVRQVDINRDTCKKCGLCAMCPGIKLGADKTPCFTNLCTNCAGQAAVCAQVCPFGAITLKAKSVDESDDHPRRGVDNHASTLTPTPTPTPTSTPTSALDADRKGLTDCDSSSINERFARTGIASDTLPESLRVAIRGIGGQGNLFLGKVLAQVALKTSYRNAHIVKGDTHGMAQLGGPVISTFACGQVYSPTLAPNSADLLVAMEVGEVLRPGFLELLKPGGAILVNRFTAIPPTAKAGDYPNPDEIIAALRANNSWRVVEIDATEVAYAMGDVSGKCANVVILGALATLDPFNRLPQAVWHKALLDVSPSQAAAAANIAAFEAGRNHDH